MCEEKKKHPEDEKDNRAWFEKDIGEWTEEDEQLAFLNITELFQ